MEVPRLFRRSKKTALPPGTLVHVGEAPPEKAVIRVVRYDAETFEEETVSDAERCLALAQEHGVTWIDVVGIHDTDLVKNLGALFDIHPLVQEDIVHAGQRAKYEDHERYLYVVLRMLRFAEEREELVAGQVSLVVGEGWVISVREKAEGLFLPLRERIRSSRGRIRRMGSGYLAYALLDTVVDNYFEVLEHLGEKAEDLEAAATANPGPETLARIHALKTGVIYIRKCIWPLRDALAGLLRDEPGLIGGETVVYLRDVHDHVLRAGDTIETYRDMIGGLVDVHLSSVSNRMNEVMKTLTIIATIFIPLTFIAGVYGMNFEHMPELKWRWGYACAMAGMGVIGAALAYYFRRKKWL